MPVEASYPLAPDAPSGSSSSSAAGSPLRGIVTGSGLLAPFRRGPADFVSGAGVTLIQNMIAQVLGTRASTDYTPGELPWRGAFGSLLHFLRHRPNDAVARELARVWTTEALARWVPQVRVKEVDSRRETGPLGQPSVILVILRYDIVGSRGEILFRDVPQNVSLLDAAA